MHPQPKTHNNSTDAAWALPRSSRPSPSTPHIAHPDRSPKCTHRAPHPAASDSAPPPARDQSSQTESQHHPAPPSQTPVDPSSTQYFESKNVAIILRRLHHIANHK